MTGFLRPEAIRFLARWREVGVGICVALASLYGIVALQGMTFYLAILGVPIAIALIWEGINRARLPELWYGSGLVEVDERQITYFGPYGGHAVSVDDLTRVEIITSDLGPFDGDIVWVLHSADAPPLIIPAGATGAQRIHDALLALPGVDFRRVVEAMGSTENRRFVIWQRVDPRRRLS